MNMERFPSQGPHEGGFEYQEQVNEEVLERMRFEDAFERLREARDLSERREVVGELYGKIKEMADAEGLSFEPGNVWGEHGNEGLLVRRGAPERDIWEALHDGEIDIKEAYDGEQKRANAADDTREGMHIAMTEGQDTSPLAVVYAFEPANVDVVHVFPAGDSVRDPERFKHIRAVSGTVPADDVKYMVLRIPRALMPEDEVLEEEEEQQFMFRSIDMKKREDEQLQQEAA